MSRANLMVMIRNRGRLSKALADARGKVGDTAEQKLFDLIEAGNLGAITFYLTSCHKDRGYGNPKELNVGDARNFMVQTINVVSLPSGRFLAPDSDDLAATLQQIGEALETPVADQQGGATEADPAYTLDKPPRFN
jgi:hypothetical protein